MAYSIVNIVNLALDELGVPSISSMTEASDAAELANRIWEYARDQALEDGDWNFAKLPAKLVQDAVYAAAPTDPKWLYRYTKPTSCLKVRELVDTNNLDIGRYWYDARAKGYVEEGDYIYCNFDNTSTDLYCRYTTIITDVTKYRPSFINALKFKLAAMMARKLVAMNPDGFEQKYVYNLTNATGKNQAQDYIEGDQGNTDWLDR
ncbi:MAG: hypothetical protein WC373_06625 [Smithella sp.]